MKKSLIALAVLGSFAGVASAQSSVSLYGIVDVWVGSVKDGLGAPSVSKLDNNGLSVSRLGFKGSEDLGGGLSAVFTLEGALSPDDGTAGRLSFNRQSFVGFEGGFGAVTAGRMWTAFDDVSAGAFTLFDSAFSPEYVAFGSTAYNANPANAIKYTSPSFGGFAGAVSYSIDEKPAAPQGFDAKVGAVNLTYSGGPLFVGFAYQQEKATATPNSLAYTRLGASYDLGVAVLKGNYGSAKDKLTDAKSTDFSFGADFPLSSQLTLGAGFARSTDNAAGGDGERTAFGLAATYALSKRTTAYAGVTSGKEENAAGAKIDEFRLYAVGVRHAF